MLETYDDYNHLIKIQKISPSSKTCYQHNVVTNITVTKLICYKVVKNQPILVQHQRTWRYSEMTKIISSSDHFEFRSFLVIHPPYHVRTFRFVINIMLIDDDKIDKGSMGESSNELIL